MEMAGVSAILLGALWAVIRYFTSLKGTDRAYEAFRSHLGRGTLVALEFLIAADIIRTVAVRATWENVGILAAIVLIRTFLSMTLSMEINAWLPWEKNRPAK